MIIFINFWKISPVFYIKFLTKWSIVILIFFLRKSVNWNYLLKWKTDPVKHCVIMYSKLLSTFFPILMLEISTSEKNISRFECNYVITQYNWAAVSSFCIHSWRGGPHGGQWIISLNRWKARGSIVSSNTVD